MYTFIGTFLSCGIILFIAVFVAGYFFHKKVKGDSGAKTDRGSTLRQVNSSCAMGARFRVRFLSAVGMEVGRIGLE